MDKFNDLIKLKKEKSKLLKEIEDMIKIETDKKIENLKYIQRKTITKYLNLLLSGVMVLFMIPIPFLLHKQSFILLLLITSTSICIGSIIVNSLKQITRNIKHNNYQENNKPKSENEIDSLYKSYENILKEINNIDKAINNKQTNQNNDKKINHVKRKVLIKDE